jgi:lipopolysaccharide biosynthesis regulator YciM
LPRRLSQFVLLTILLVLIGLAGYACYLYARAEFAFRAAQEAARRRDFGRAGQLLEAYLQEWPRSSRARFLLARVARQNGKYLQAEDELERCQRLEGATERIALERTLLQTQQGAISRPMEVQLRQYVADGHPEAEQILEALAHGCLLSYRFPAAVAYLNQWLERDPDNVQAYLWRSVAHERVLNLAAARDDCRQALARDPDRVEAQVRLGQVLLLTTEYQEAVAWLEPLHRQQPGNPVVGLALAKALAKVDRAQDAEQILDELVRRFPSDAPVLLERGRLALEHGQAAAAERWLGEAANRVPYDYQTNYSLLLCLQQAGKKAAAAKVQEHLRRLEADSAQFREWTDRLQQHPYDLAARCEIARVYFREGNGREAVVWLKSALKIKPTYQLANRLMVEYYEESGQPALAAPYRAAAGPAQTERLLLSSDALPADSEIGGPGPEGP